MALESRHKPIQNKKWRETEQVLKQIVPGGGAAALQGAHGTKMLEESDGFLLYLVSLGRRNSTVFYLPEVAEACLWYFFFFCFWLMKILIY